MSTIATDLSTIFYEHPSATVAVSEKLSSGFVDVDYLYLDRLRLELAPSIDIAEFSYEYGPQLRPDQTSPDQYDPLEHLNKFVRVTIPATVDGDDDIVWYGILEVDQRAPIGSQGDTDPNATDPSGNPAGAQRLVGYGLLRLLERRRVHNSLIQRSGEFFVESATSDAIFGGNSGLTIGDKVNFITTGTLPAGLSAATDYYIIDALPTGFEISASPGGSSVSITDDGIGIHTWRANSSLEIGRALDFNRDQKGQHEPRGNRANVVEYDTVVADSRKVTEDTVFPFHYSRRAGAIWDAEEAVKYTLAYDAPILDEITTYVTWVLADANYFVGSGAALRWADFSVAREGRTVKEIIDELIPRRRGLWYYVKFDPAVDEIVLHAGTFATDEIELPSGKEIPKNDNPKTLDFEQAFDIEQVQLTNLATQQFDEITVLGAYRTSTLSAPFGEVKSGNTEALVPDWTSAEEEDYRVASTNATGYADLTFDEQYRVNRAFRDGDEMAHVFSRFRIRADWNQLINPSELSAAFPDDEYFVVPPLDADGAPVQPHNGVTNPDPEFQVWSQGLQIEPRLALKERLDYSGTNIEDGAFANDDFAGREEFLAPMVFVVSTDQIDGADIWSHIDKAPNPGEIDPRKWNASIRVLDSGPQIEVRAQPANQMIAKAEWTDNAPPAGDIAETEPEEDPTRAGGADWKTQLFATLTIRIDERLAHTEVINADADNNPRVLEIRRPDLRLDYVTPYTIFSLNGEANEKGGTPRVTTSGGFVRDDRDKAKDIAVAAKLWYGIERQAFSVTFKQIRPIIELGWLIEDIGANYNRTDVNSVVSAVEYRMPIPSERSEPGETTIETSFTALDF